MLHDYTFQIVSRCGSGTGWILDFQVPKEGHYPTVWYIATAAHVIDTWKFDEQNNTYNQKLPKSCIHDLNTPSYLIIAKRDEKDGRTAYQEVIKNPKIFWAALDLFKKDEEPDIKLNSLKDFAVLEITFENAETAKNITKNFAEKYKTGPDDGINIFGKALDPKKTKTNNSRFYTLGYPSNEAGEFYLKNNWSDSKQKGDVLSNDDSNRFQIPEKEKVRGFLSIDKHLLSSRGRQMVWGDKEYNIFGHFYYTEGSWIGPGSSGSMMIDERANLLGVRSMAGKEYSLITPLRSEEAIQGEIKTTKYDLILGATGQKSSYKKQVEDYLLKHNKKTWLSTSQKWTYPAQA